MDWYSDHSLTSDQQDHLSGLDELRREEPVVWAMLCGVQSSRSIAMKICWPHEDVMIELRRLKAEGLTYDVEGQKSVLWAFKTDEAEHMEYIEWIRTQRRRGGLFNPNENEE